MALNESFVWKFRLQVGRFKLRNYTAPSPCAPILLPVSVIIFLCEKAATYGSNRDCATTKNNSPCAARDHQASLIISKQFGQAASDKRSAGFDSTLLACVIWIVSAIQIECAVEWTTVSWTKTNLIGWSWSARARARRLTAHFFLWTRLAGYHSTHVLKYTIYPGAEPNMGRSISSAR